MLKQKISTSRYLNKIFKNWGPNHISFSGAKIIGCFNVDAKVSSLGVLVALYARD
jgi:hypothetical protein